MMRFRKFIAVFLFVFLFSFAFYQFLLAGTPFHYGEDTDVLKIGLETPSSALLSLSLNPFSRHLYRFGMDTALQTRPVETLIFKIVGSVFGFHAGPLYATKTFFSAFVCAGLFLILFSATSSYGMAFLGWLFFLSAPSVYASVRYIHDYEMVSQCFTLLSLACFFFLNEKENSLGKNLFLAAGSILTGILAIRTKETSKTLPLTLILFLFIRTFWNRTKASGKPVKGEKLQWMTALFFLVSALLPFFLSSRPSAGSFGWHPENIFYFLVRNPFGFESEKQIALFTLENTMPGSFIGTFGFYFGWVFLLLLTAGFCQKKKVLPPRFYSILQLSIAWWITTSAGYALIERLDDRFLTVSMTPAVIASFLGLHWALEKLKAYSVRIFSWTTGFLVLIFFMNAQRNLDHLIFCRNFLGGWLVAEGKIFERMTEDHLQTKSPSEQQIYHYLREEIPKEMLELVRPMEGWDHPPDPVLINKLKESQPYLYAASPDKNIFAKDAEWKLLAEVNTLSDSLYGRLMKNIKKKASRQLYLFKWEKRAAPLTPALK